MALTLSKFSENLAVTGVVALSQAVIGVGTGLLVADHVGKTVRQRAAVALIGAGLATAVPLVVSVINCMIYRPTSRRAMRKRLKSIRNDAGVAEGESVV